MNKYTIYCTPEQTKKALELGAPIKECGYYFKKQIGCNTISDTDLHIIPTAEQMIGWLEENGISTRGNCFSWAEEHHKPSWQVHVFDKENNFWVEKLRMVINGLTNVNIILNHPDSHRYHAILYQKCTVHRF